MPRQLVRAPAHERSRSLGWLALAWLEHFVVHGPGDAQGDPVVHGDEYSGLVADCYALAEDGRRLYDSAFISRPKGCDKSGMGARFALVEALGPVRFAGWAQGGESYRLLDFRYQYEPGEPMGRPVQSPYVRLMATEEGQTGNVYDTVYSNLSEGPLSELDGLDVGLTRINLAGGGQIVPSTASSASKDGGIETFVCFDETHLYHTPELRRMYNTVTRNLRKRGRVAQPWSLETTTMFAPGQDSVAEATYLLAEAIREGRSRRQRLLFDHRWGECEDLADEPALRAALADAYGDAMAWNDLGSLVDGVYDPRAHVTDSRRFFLNAQTATSDAWITPAEWAGCADATRSLADGDLVTLGFDGSVRDDSTALVACRVSDGHLELLGCWEKPAGPEGDGWQVDRVAVDAAVARAFGRFAVVGMFADPAHWQDYLDQWSREFAGQVQVKASREHPLEWWTNRPRPMIDALERFHEAVLAQGLSHDGGSVLTRHVTNARRRELGRSGMGIGKDRKGSDRKIDAAMAATLAYECRAAAVAAGVKPAAEKFFVARRLR